MRNKKSISGVITVLVSLLLVGILSIGTLIIEAGRLQAAKTQLMEANISASTSMIAAYNPVLYERYGLLAIDAERFTVGRATDYLQFNADNAVGYAGNRISQMYTIDSVELTGLYNLTNPAVLKRQILSRAKYNVVPEDHAINIYTVDAFFTDFQSKCRYVVEQLAPLVDGTAEDGQLSDIPADVYETIRLLEKVYDYDKLEKNNKHLDGYVGGGGWYTLPSLHGNTQNDVPEEDLESIQENMAAASTLLGPAGSALNITGDVSKEEVDVSIPSAWLSTYQMYMYYDDGDGLPERVRSAAEEVYKMAQGMDMAITILMEDKESNLLLNSYIIDYFSNRNYRLESYCGPESGQKDWSNNLGLVSSCVEYIMDGAMGEEDCQNYVFDQLWRVRLISNLYAIIGESNWFDNSNVHNVLAHLVWAVYESVIDAELLSILNVEVPFNKETRFLPINNPQAVKEAYTTGVALDTIELPDVGIEGTSFRYTLRTLKKFGFYKEDTFVIPGFYAFDYTDSLSVGLWFVPNSKKLVRIADLIQMEMRYREHYVEKKPATFLLSEQNTFCRIKCVGRMTSVLPVLSLSTNDNKKGVTFQSIKYAGY